jgi:hypothetical protein
MAVSAQSGAMRAVPGMGQRPASMAAYTPTYPSIPTLPAVPALDRDAQTPNYVGRQLVSQQLGQLGNQQNAAFTTAGANAGQALKGYGGYQFQKDDPTTAAREDLLLNFDPSRGPGEREKAAIREQQYAANASGMLESGFANQNIASAVQRVSLEAQATDYANQGANLAMQYAGLYGQDAAWLVANPPPAPPVNPNSNPYNGSPYSAGIIEQSVAPIWDWAERVGVGQMAPDNPAAGVNGGWGQGRGVGVKPTYKAWLGGRKSTAALAAKWKAL